MPIVVGLTEEYEDGAAILAEYYGAKGRTYPRAVFALKRLAEAERSKGKPKKTAKRKRTIKAHVGKGKGKAGDFQIQTKRLQEP